MENKGTEKKKRDSYKIVPLRDQKEAIKAILSGEMTRKEVAELYGVHVASIQRWLVKAQAGFPMRTRKDTNRSSDDWRRIAQEIKTGLVSIEDAVIQYQIQNRRTLLGWIRKSDSEIVPAKQLTQEIMIGGTGNFEDENRKLIQQLNQAQLKILALETMIEVAGEEYGDDLRKKFGSKQ